MPKATVEEYKSELIPEDTLVRARLESVVTKQINWADKETGEARSKDLWRWDWKVTDGDYKGVSVRGETNAKLSTHPENRPRNWAETLLGRELPPGVEFDTDDVVGLSADITVRHRPSKAPGDDRVFQEVDEVLPVSQSAAVPF